MYVISTFEQSLFLELAITELEERGIARDKILAVPLDKKVEEKNVFDTIHRADGISLFDGAASLGAVFMILGTIYGFVWKWGPIIWAVIGLFFGAGLGFILDFMIRRKRPNSKKATGQSTEVVLIIKCNGNQFEMVEKTLWQHFALGVAKLDRN